MFSVSDEMLWVMGPSGRRQVDCSRVVGQHPAAAKAIADSDTPRRAAWLSSVFQN